MEQLTKAEFRANHLPALRLVCACYGLPVAWKNTSFGEAMDGVMAEALRLGADRLSPAALADLERWISENLTVEAAKHAVAADAYHAMAEKWAANREAWMAEFHRRSAA